MGALNIWHILLIVVAAALLFGGRGKISSLMGDTAKGIKAFKEGLKGDEQEAEEEAKPLPKTRKKDTARS
ncbi:twin-arginine translocase TatA/TatE family subunit [Phenylobacterium sp.]|jgi:sec-independent protein translocase protein TatA|uniref:twin-arginine translocase TatA/TatE family subunit n=1 Tax=Phenylobacterium sp. TaxID=1871053 RepID=UPI002F94F5B3